MTDPTERRSGPDQDALERVRRAVASRYAVERELGAGGMAIVYEARDLRHGRKVALKVLRPELSAALAAERFLREIETSANLRHPHIVPLYDSGEADGFLFYVMPLIEGESLRSRLGRDGQLPLQEALQITSEVADALAYAHGRGVIHRDIKPENVLLERGHAIVVDFGITRLLSEARTPRATLTQAGMVLGTPQYMSPEQATGDRDLDARSDLYSLGCMLYEMLAGQPPFTGPSVERLFHQHLMATPPPLSRFRPTIPIEVSNALQRALAKAPAQRFGSTLDFAEALVAPRIERTGERSVAVLPFLNLSADPDNEYFADGITEDVIAQLSKIHDLKVVSRASVMPFKRRDVGLREIATQLQVGALLDGSVRRAGGRVRIVAQLIDAETDQNLWTETFDRDLTDIFAIQSEVALRIAEALQAELSPDERARIRREPTADPRVYELYLQGRHQMIRYTDKNLRRAIENFERAIDLDAEFAPAFTGIASALIELGEMGLMKPEEAYPRAQAAASHALALDNELSEAHCTDAYGKLVYEFDWAGAEHGFRRAIELSPSNADAYDLYGRLCSALRRYDEALDLMRRAQSLDPLAHRVDVATALLRAGRAAEAATASRHAVELDPDDARARSTLGWALLRSGELEEGLASIERAVELAPGNNMWLAQLGEAHGLYGSTERAHEILRHLVDESASRYVAPYHLAYVYTGLGLHDDAVDRLEEAFEDRAGAMYGVAGSFLFEPLQSHPRFQDLMRRMRIG